MNSRPPPRPTSRYRPRSSRPAFPKLDEVDKLPVNGIASIARYQASQPLLLPTNNRLQLPASLNLALYTTKTLRHPETLDPTILLPISHLRKATRHCTTKRVFDRLNHLQLPPDT